DALQSRGLLLGGCVFSLDRGTDSDWRHIGGVRNEPGRRRALDSDFVGADLDYRRRCRSDVGQPRLCKEGSMNRLRDEMKVIPRPVYALSVLLTLGILIGVVAFQLVEVYSASNFGFLPLFAILIFIGLSFSIYILLVGYIYGDARRRGMRP